MGGIVGGGGGEPSGQGPSQTTVQKSEPWAAQQPYLTKGFEEAQKLFLDTTPTYYQGNTVVPFSDETTQAMDLTKQRALSGSPLNNASRDQIAKTINGDYLYGGEGFNAAVDAATRRVLPQVDSQFGMSGGYGSGLAQEAKTRAITDAFASQYGQERTNQQNASMFAPQLAEAEYNDIARLAAVGGQKEALAGEVTADQIARHDFDQSVKQRQLQNYMNLVQGQYGGETTKTSPGAPYYNNTGAGILGGALGGASLAKSIGFGGMGTGIGAALGGLLGM